MRWLGWLFILSGVSLVICAVLNVDQLLRVSPHLLMAGIFGGLHLAYGIYLYLTEKRKNAT